MRAAGSVPEPKQCQPKESLPGVSELVRLRGRAGLYEVRGIDQANGIVHVFRNIPKRPIEEKVPLDTICELNEHTAHLIGCFLKS